jgi:hypothetical protein
MNSEPRTIRDFPNEILSQCFSHLRIERHTGWPSSESKLDIPNLRLVCRRFNAVSAPLLICSVRVDITSDSLRLLEEISWHPIFSKSIKQVEINVSYYDACIANDMALFAQHNSTALFQTLEMMERGCSDEEEIDFQGGYRTLKDWNTISSTSTDKFTKKQLLLLEALKKYSQLFDDQEEVKANGGHIKRICSSLGRLPALDSIDINDEMRRRSCDKGEEEFSNEYLLAYCLTPSSWKGSFITAFVTAPPVEIIPELFTSLARSTIRPSKFKISITPPNDLRCMALSTAQQEDVKTVLQRSCHLCLNVRSWARKGSLAENNDRHREEMLALCSLTQAFFDTSNLVILDLSFSDYPVFYERPQVDILDILPLTCEEKWQNLRSLKLRHIPRTYIQDSC